MPKPIIKFDVDYAPKLISVARTVADPVNKALQLFEACSGRAIIQHKFKAWDITVKVQQIFLRDQIGRECIYHSRQHCVAVGYHKKVRDQDRSVYRKCLEVGRQDRPFADKTVKSLGAVKIDQFVIVRVHKASFLVGYFRRDSKNIVPY